MVAPPAGSRAVTPPGVFSPVSLSAMRNGNQRGGEKNQDPHCGTHPEHPFLGLQSLLHLPDREFCIPPTCDRKVARFFFPDDSDCHGIVRAAPDLYTVK